MLQIPMSVAPLVFLGGLFLGYEVTATWYQNEIKDQQIKAMALHHEALLERDMVESDLRQKITRIEQDAAKERTKANADYNQLLDSLRRMSEHTAAGGGKGRMPASGGADTGASADTVRDDVYAESLQRARENLLRLGQECDLKLMRCNQLIQAVREARNGDHGDTQGDGAP